MLKKIAVILFGALVLAGCSNLNHREQRTLTGGAIGAAGGATIGALTGGSAVMGAVMGGVIGGAAGAAVGALTSDSGKRRR